jgi:hypothetical protein
MSSGCGQVRLNKARRKKMIILALIWRYEKTEARLHYSRASGWMLASPSPVVFFAQYFFTHAS